MLHRVGKQRRSAASKNEAAMGETAWIVLAATLVGGGVSLLTTWLNAFIAAKAQRAKDAREDAAIRAAVMSLPC